MDFHLEQLGKSCRVCGNRLKTTKGKGRAFDCSAHASQLLETFSLNVSDDANDIHPSQFCFSCYGTIRRKAAAAKKGLPYTSPALVIQQVCQHFTAIVTGGGQNRKRELSSGRPCGVTPSRMISELKDIAPASFFPPADSAPPRYILDLSPHVLECSICAGIPERPIELLCGNIVCLVCCTSSVRAG